MPPKRKAPAEDSEKTQNAATASGRSTRSSTRKTKVATTEETPVVTAKASKASGSSRTKKPKEDTDEPPPPKRARLSRTIGTSKTSKVEAVKGQSRDVNSNDQETASSNLQDGPEQSSKSQTTESTTHPKNAPPSTKSEPYTPARAIQLFEAYVDADDPTLIGPEGLEKLCSDANIPLDGAMPLILAWQLNSKEMGKFTKDEWVAGTSALKVASLPPLHTALSDLDSLLIFDKPAIKSVGKKDPYDRSNYVSYAQNKKSAFQKLYMFCFNLAKPEQSRNIDMETSCALWGVLLAPKYSLMEEVLRFITEKSGTYKATNKDLWSMMLEFCDTVKPDLQDYEADGAWPTLLDDFVAWKKADSS